MSFAHITLATRDVARTCTFFEQVFGWSPIRRPDNLDRSSAWLELAPNQQLHLLQVDDFAASPFEAEFGRHVAVFYPGRQFTELKQRLRQHGAELITPQRETAFERFFFRDPNGYLFEVIDEQGYVAG